MGERVPSATLSSFQRRATGVRDKLIEAWILLMGIVASLSAYVDTHKPWVAACVLGGFMAMDEILVRLRRSSDP